MAGEPLLSCDDARLRVFIDQVKIGDDLAVKYSVKARATTYEDDHIGNRFSRLDMRVWGYDLNASFHVATTALLDAMAAYYKALKTPGATIPQLAVFVGIQERAGAALLKGLMFTGAVAVYNLDLPGMKERMMQGLDIKAEQMATQLLTV